MNRREFLQSTAAGAVVAGVAGGVSIGAQAGAPGTEMAWPENGTLIPDEGWRLWIDERAEWKNDALFLPEDVTRRADGVLMGGEKPLPVNPPTGGWGVLAKGGRGEVEGKVVTLPSTVEQHYWGKFGAGTDGKPRSYTPDEYRYAADDPPPQNGAYFGVSWWWRALEIPREMTGKRIFLHVRGARLRAEVYLNERLVGYSIMEELPFECDLTAAARPGGENRLAIRITNPFGRFDWVDGANEQWGAVKLYRSHGFGGLDRGMTLSAHDEVRIKDAWVLNSTEPKTIYAYLEVDGMSLPTDHENTRIAYNISDLRTGRTLARSGTGYYAERISQREAKLKGKGSASMILRLKIKCDEAQLWDLDEPANYSIALILTHPNVDQRQVPFGFRAFAPEGIGTDALFRLNGRRMKIYTAISWGYWGLNGMWPTPELAVKEVTQAKKLGLNCLNFHRNLAKEDVLRAHDRLGLLRYMEPGAGKMAIGKLPSGVLSNAASIVMEKPTDAADKFAQRFMFVKCVEMVKAFRSHPSVIEYCLQNEIGADLSNPDTIAVLEAMRAEDPSRCIVLNDGFVAPPRKAAQAWFEPWNPKLHRSDQEEWGGWWNQHQGAGDQWYDAFYKSPAEFTYKSPEKKALSEFGEMEGCAVPDNHSLMLHELGDPKGTGIGNQPANTSYDLQDHREIVAAYDKFLDRWGFREAFPATEKLWASLGKKCYDTWQNYLENARISDELDFAAISGWESTSIENHSGIVDNLRNFKGDPGLIAGALMPVRPVAKQRAMCVEKGKAATFDLYLLNDTSKVVGGTLEFSAVTPSGKMMKVGQFPAPSQTPDVFSYLVKEGFVTPQLIEAGMWRFKFSVSSMPLNTQTKEIWVADSWFESFSPTKIGVSGIAPALRKQLASLMDVVVSDFAPGEKYSAIVSSGVVAQGATTQNAGDTTGLEAQPAGGTAVRRPPQIGVLAEGIVEAVRAGTPLLAIPQTDALSDGVAKQLAAAGAFTYSGSVGDVRAPWMGNWYFVRKHPVYDGMPVDQAMGIHYQAKGSAANGLLVDGPGVEIVAGYSRDHSRVIGAGTFTAKLGAGKVLYQRVPEMQPVMQQRFLANALRWLVG